MINQFWTGKFGRYLVHTNMVLGAGGLTAFVGSVDAGGRGELGGRIMWLHRPREEFGPIYMRGFYGRLAAHEFGHNLGLDHDAGALMSKGAAGPVTEAHIDQLLAMCGSSR